MQTKSYIVIGDIGDLGCKKSITDNLTLMYCDSPKTQVNYGYLRINQVIIFEKKTQRI